MAKDVISRWASLYTTQTLRGKASVTAQSVRFQKRLARLGKKLTLDLPYKDF